MMNRRRPSGRHTSLAIISALATVASAQAGDPPCEPHWDNTIGQPGMDHNVWDLAVFDDGSGPALYACGEFMAAGGTAANRVAKWDGASWLPLGNGIDSLTLHPYAMAAFDDGNGADLYVGGKFDSADGMAVSNIARWDGSAWSDVGGGTNGRIYDLAVYDDGNGSSLYAVGQFTVAGGRPATGVARWDGSTWSPLGSGVDGSFIYAVHGFDDGSGPAIYVGGLFATDQGDEFDYLAKWDGASWSAVGAGLNHQVRAFATFDDGSGPALYAGGQFSFNNGTHIVSRVTKWDGENWLPLGAGVDELVRDLVVFDDGTGPALYAAGAFSNAGGASAKRVARWDGKSWSPLGSGIGVGNVFTLAVFDDGSSNGPSLYAGNGFAGAGGLPSNGIAQWVGCTPDVIPADLDGDGAVGVGDLLILLGAWGACDTPSQCAADVDGDDRVGVGDLLALLAAWS